MINEKTFFFKIGGRKQRHDLLKRQFMTQEELIAKKKQEELNAIKQRQDLLNARKKQAVLNARKKQAVLNARRKQEALNARKKQAVLNARKKQKELAAKKKGKKKKVKQKKQEILDKFDVSEQLYKIIKKCGFTLENYNKYTRLSDKQKKNRITANGIGDLLITTLLIKKKKIQIPVYINLIYYENTNVYHNPINFLIFRCNLLKKIFNCNNIPLDSIRFILDPNASCNGHIAEQFELKNWNLKLPSSFLLEKNIYLNDKPYIIFHTKIRMLGSTNYSLIRENLKLFYENYTTTYTIVLMGEQEITPYKGEEIHGISTIYNELKFLKKNNNVIDLTKKDIYRSLNYEEYINDMEIVKNAKANIIVGCGGHYVSSLIFSDGPVFTYFDNNMICTHPNWLINNIFRNSIYSDINFYFNDLKMLNSSLIEIQKNTINFIRDNKSKNICIVIPHNGLDDNLNTMSMCNYLSTKYDIVIHCVCNMEIYNNMKLFYSKNNKIIVFPLNTYICTTTWTSVANFVENEIFKYVNKIYALGLHNSNKYLIERNFKHSSDIINKPYCGNFIPFTFYINVKLSRDIYWKHINIPDILESDNLYKVIKDIPYIFLANKSSNGIQFDEKKVLNKLSLSYDKVLVINPNINFYNSDHKFYKLANKFISKPILYYKKILENARYIVLYPTSFFYFAIQLDLKTDNCYYYHTKDVYQYIFKDTQTKQVGWTGNSARNKQLSNILYDLPIKLYKKKFSLISL